MDREALDRQITQLLGGDKELAREWWVSPVPFLSDQAPEDLMGTEEGRERVQQLISAIKYGDFS